MNILLASTAKQRTAKNLEIVKERFLNETNEKIMSAVENGEHSVTVFIPRPNILQFLIDELKASGYVVRRSDHDRKSISIIWI